MNKIGGKLVYDSKEEAAIYVLRNFKRIAVVGCSRQEGKPSHDVPAYLKNAGYTIVPVNPFADEILGEKSYKSLLEIPSSIRIEVVDVFRPGSEALAIAKDTVKIGAKALWLQEGIFSDEAERYASENGIIFIENRCMMKERERLLLEKKLY
ncbi:MAG: CoA-binding protein [Candidatus Micrarchaeaceae archaeon]